MSTRRASSLLVGREEELLALEAAVSDRASRPVTLIAGEAGVGKTRLVAEFLARQPTGSLTTLGACIELGADLVPYAPFIDAIGRHLEAIDEDSPAAGAGVAGELRTLLPDLGEIVPDLATLLPGLAPGGTAGGPVSRGRMYEAVRTLLDRAPSPLVCVLEDFHWADRSSLELLAYLARRLRHGRTAIVVTFRTDDLHRRHPLVPVLAELERSGRTTRIDVGRLDRARVATLVREIRGDASEALVEAIARRSQGIPFLAEELLAVDAGVGEPLPETLRELLLARLATLHDQARDVLAIVAAVERPADGELLEAAWDGPPRRFEAGLREAVDRGILVIDPATGRVAFRHALLGEAVVDDLLPGERVRLHATLARVLAERPELARPTAAGAAAEVAHHLFRARDLPAALRASATAGDAAVTARAYPEARELYERALELLERLPDAADRARVDPIRLLDAAAEASFHAGDIARAVALGSRAAEASEAEGDQARTGYLLGRLVEWTELSGDFTRVAALAERAVALVPDLPPSRERAYALIGLAAARGHAGRARECLEIARDAIEVAVACGATPQEAVARSNAAAALAKLGRDAEAVAEIDRAVLLADRSRGTEETSVVQTDRAVIRATAARFTDLGDIIDEVRAALDREGSLEVHDPWVVAPETELLAWQGRWAEAEALTTRLIEGNTRPCPLASHLVMRGKLRTRTGRLDDATRDLRAAIDVRPSAEPDTRADALGCLAEVELLRADPRRSLALVDEALGVLAPTDELPQRVHLLALGLEAAADVHEWARARRDDARCAEAEAAGRRYAAALRAAEAGELVDGGGTEERIRSRVAWGKAEDARRAGSAPPDIWAIAAAALAEAGEPYLSATCRVREAEAAIACLGNRARSREILRETLAWARQVGAAPLSSSIEALARRARLDLAGPEVDADASDGARPTRGIPPDPFGLSEREREVLALLIDGRTNREIGAELFISEKTASVHVTHILDKMGVASRGAAAALAARGHLAVPSRD
ncbi:MAG TPA: AAA family ATPase [Candidatus Sulfomarinibacteraceae bacterium]|nr:AAA family ATPase [Candidatus Sulfomarinibacteraceae bacterium]